ncbi:MAG: c-type cytochrome, partial [Planctomycetota bacterium]
MSSILFLIAVFWMVIDDSAGPWKKYQREFRDIEVERARQALESDGAKAAMDREKELLAELEAVTERVNSGGGALADLQAELKAAEGEQYVAVEAFKASKEYFNDTKRIVEHELMHVEDEEKRAELEGELFEKKNIMDEAALEREVIDLQVAELEAKIKAAKAEIADAEVAAKAAVRDIDLTRKKLGQLAPEAPDEKIANILRDFPGLDFIDPNLKVRKIVLANLTFELNFTKKNRIDMCITCHMAADLPGYDLDSEGNPLEEPYRSHPNLDLFLSAKSPHPMSEIGCTICHRGSGEALQFTRADHVPTDEAEEEEWHDEYHWHKQHHWDYPMLSSKYIEASCVQCHKDSMDLIAPSAPKVSEGYELFERYGCYSCHKVEWYPTKRKPGPSLENLQAKLTPDFIEPWIANPKAFRPTTWMPQLFHLENFEADERIDVFKKTDADGNVTERDILGSDWNTNAVAAVAAFLRDRAPEEAYPAIPVEGDAERGREVMRVVGCYSCHNTAPYDDEPLEVPVADPTHERGRYNQHGPNLRGVATKIKPEWLYAWIKNPAEYWPETRMPNLRLSDQDAADITAYVMEDPDSVFTDTPPGWEPQNSEYDIDVLQSMAKRFFNRAGTPVLKARFAGEDPEHRWDRAEDLLVDVGEKFLTHQGCYSCHSVEGYQTTMPIGAELT